MKKPFKTLTAFLLLFALITSIKPIQPPVGKDTKPGIAVCGDDDTAATNVISKK